MNLMNDFKQVSGVWMDITDPAGYVTANPLIDGLPTYQYEQLDACVKACGKRLHTVIDGGAHIGLWSIHLVKKFQQVIAFEPMFKNFKCLRLNTLSNVNITLYQAALSNYTGQIGMAGRGSKSFKWWVTPQGSIIDKFVSCLKLDTLNLQNVDLIKLDVESHEFEALQGAAETIQRCKPIIMIEDKLDPEKRATKYLQELGMNMIWSRKHDYLFVWPKTDEKEANHGITNPT